MNDKTEKTIHIRLLEYGEKVGLTGATWDSTTEWAVENKVIPQKKGDEADLLKELFLECFASTSRSTAVTRVLKAEYFFRLLEYRELCEVRETSRQANQNAWIAIVISVIALIITSLIGYYQTTRPIDINKEQIVAIVNTIKKIESGSLQEILTKLNKNKDTELVLNTDQFNQIINAIKNSSDEKITISQRQAKEIIRALKDTNVK